MKTLLDECRLNFGETPRKFSTEQQEYLRITRPLWLRLCFFDRLNAIYWRQHRIMREGKVVWGVTLQANSLLFEKKRLDCPAEVLFTFDKRMDDAPETLAEVAHKLYLLKGTPQTDPALANVSYVLAHEMIRTSRKKISFEMSRGFDIFWTTIMVSRKHLPDGYLANRIFPLVVHEEIRSAMILPSRFWAPQLLAMWRIKRPRS